MSTTQHETYRYTVRCHCGNVSARIRCNSNKLVIWKCDCSDCNMRGNVHFVIPKSDLEMNEAEVNEQTILYLWGTKTARRRFCKTCGVLPWYIPRSNPDGYGITVACVEFGDKKPEIEVREYDGVNWEKTYATSAIVNESKEA